MLEYTDNIEANINKKILTTTRHLLCTRVFLNKQNVNEDVQLKVFKTSLILTIINEYES